MQKWTEVTKWTEVPWTVQLLCADVCELRKHNQRITVRLPLVAHRSSIATAVTNLVERIAPSAQNSAAFIRRRHVRVEFWRGARHILVRMPQCPESSEYTCEPFKLPLGVQLYRVATALATGAVVVLSSTVLANMVQRTQRYQQFSQMFISASQTAKEVVQTAQQAYDTKTELQAVLKGEKDLDLKTEGAMVAQTVLKTLGIENVNQVGDGLEMLVQSGKESVEVVLRAFLVGSSHYLFEFIFTSIVPAPNVVLTFQLVRYMVAMATLIAGRHKFASLISNIPGVGFLAIKGPVEQNRAWFAMCKDGALASGSTVAKGWQWVTSKVSDIGNVLKSAAIAPGLHSRHQ